MFAPAAASALMFGAAALPIMSEKEWFSSITTTMWDRRATLHHAQLVEHLTQSDPVASQAFANLNAGGMGTDQSYALVNRLVDQQAFMLSADDIFYVSGLLFLALIVLIWFARPIRGGGGGGAEAAAGAH